MTSMKPVLLVTTVIITTSVFFAVIRRLLERYDREKRKQEFQQLLEEERYFKGIAYEINWLFGEGRNSRVLDVTKEMAEEFRDAEKYAAYLYLYFGFNIKAETLDHLVNCYLWVRAADRICDTHPEYEEFRESVYPTFYMRYMSKGLRDYAIGEYSLSQQNIRSLYNEIWYRLNPDEKAGDEPEGNAA